MSERRNPGYMKKWRKWCQAFGYKPFFSHHTTLGKWRMVIRPGYPSLAIIGRGAARSVVIGGSDREERGVDLPQSEAEFLALIM